jgi:hypothetical protein
MREQDTYTFLLARERKLTQELALVRELIRASEAWQKGESPDVEVQAPQGRGVAPASPSQSVPGIAGELSVVVPPSPPPPFFTEEERMKLLIRAGGNGRGAIQARVELIVAECGETFSIRDVLPKYIATYGKDRYHLPESISSALWKLARNRGYLVVRKGSGTQPTIYRKQSNGQPAGNARLSP